MRFSSVASIASMDKYCIDKIGIDGLVLMENAVINILTSINDEFNSFAIVCGRGNNGGDGFALARHLFNRNKKIDLFLIGDENKLSRECRINYNIVKNMGLKVNGIKSQEDLYLLENIINSSDCTIDCIFGTGLSRNVEGIYKETIEIINNKAAYIYAIDIPSGLNGDTGQALNVSIKADETITLGLYKMGFLNNEEENYTGKVCVRSIGMVESALEMFKENRYIVSEDYIKEHLKEKNNYSNKGDFGRVVVIAGSDGYSGAAYLTTMATVKGGAGLTSLLTNEEVKLALSIKLTEAMVISLQDVYRKNKLIKSANAIAMGPGLGNNEGTYERLIEIIEKTDCPLVLDADALNVLQGRADILKSASNNIIITPHPYEMARISGYDLKYVNKNRINIAEKFAKDYKVIVVLKGHRTIITDGNFTYVNSSGNSKMASGGMGDSLTGFILSFLAQGYNAIDAAVLAVYFHGACGDKLGKTMDSITASMIVDEFPIIVNDIRNKKLT
ncbi:MAG: NAD(P)H-hydrate dehydratase [Clostridiaceae bacterium]